MHDTIDSLPTDTMRNYRLSQITLSKLKLLGYGEFNPLMNKTQHVRFVIF
jgi:hypothetical protein